MRIAEAEAPLWRAANKGFWGALGMGDFYYELGVQLVEVSQRPNTTPPTRMSRAVTLPTRSAWSSARARAGSTA